MRAKKSPEIVLHARPLLAPERPFLLFGDLPVCLSSSLAPNPDTLMRVVTGHGVTNLIRRGAPEIICLMRKLAYVDKQKHGLSPGLRNLTVNALGRFGPLFSADIVRAALDNKDVLVEPSDRPWALLLAGMHQSAPLDADDPLVRFCQWMQDCDEYGFFAESEFRAGRHVEAGVLLADIFGPSLDAWRTLNPQLVTRVLTSIEIPLLAIARLDVEWGMKIASQEVAQATLQFLLEPTARPIGHWLKRLCSIVRCGDLGDLSRELLRAGASYRGQHISHARLKKWARSSEVVMPFEAMQSLRTLAQDAVAREVLQAQFCSARLFTYLCDLVRAFTVGDAPTMRDAQEMLRARYKQAFWQQARHLRRP